MASKIILKKSSVAAKVPTTGDLDFGELAINYNDGKLYFKKSDGSIDAFATASAAGVTSFNGLTGAITATHALNAIKDVDGAGSGLDADFLDGLHASSFYLASNPNGYTSNTGTVTSVTAGTGLTGGSITTSGTIALATSGVTAGTYTKITVDSYGRATSGASLSSSDVTTALGYTPYNSTNPNGYQTAANISSFFGSPSTSGTLDWNDISNTKPGAYGSLLLGTASNGPGGSMYFHPFNLEYSSKDGTGNVTQMAIAYGSPGNELYMRGRYSGNWSTWVRYLNSSNYNSYSPTLTGGGASGTWGINITGNSNYSSSSGNADTVDSLHADSFLRRDVTNSMFAGQGSALAFENQTSFFRFAFNDVRFYDWNNGYDIFGLNDYAWAANSFRAPIFYDSNDTNYYLDPTSTSRLGGLTLSCNVSTGRGSYGSGTANLVLLADSTYGKAVIDFRSGVNYPSDGAQIYYETATNGSSGETSRLVIRTENDADDSILIRGGYIVVNSTTVDGGSSSPGFQTQYNGSARIYTYSDNTTEAGSFRAPIFYDSDDTNRYVNPNGDSRLNDVYSHNWFRNYGQQGLYNQDYGGHFYMQSGGVWSMTGNGGNFELQCRANHNSTIRGYLYGDTSNNFGLLNQNGSWKVRVNGSEVELYDYTYTNDLRTYILYDRNDTGYYLDPNSNSNLYKVTGYQGAKYQSTDWADAFRNTPTSGRAFHGDVSSGGPQGTWWFYDSMRHSNGSNYWGTQIAYGWEDNANEIWQRNISGNSFSGWVRYLNSNNYSSYAVKINDWHGNLYHHTDGRIYATIYYDANNSGYYVDPNSTSYVYYLQSATTVRADSDRRLKDNIKPIESALSKVRQLQGCTYTRKDLEDKTKIYMGMIAQDVLPVVPEVVSGSEQGYYSLGYAELVPLLNEAIKEQDMIIQNQEARIKRLESLIEKLI